MTISSAQSITTVAGNGSQTAFSFGFVADAASDISVSSIGSNGSITLLSPTTYSVTLNPATSNQLWPVGGIVIYPLVGSPIPTGTYLQIQRILPLTQLITTQNQGNYYAQVTEQALDTIEMQLQQVASRSSQWRGIWITGISYNYGDIVQDGSHGNNTGNFYMCAIANTSGTWATDLANGDWTVSVLATVPSGLLTLTGDITGSGSSPIATTLATVNSSVGSYTNANITVDGKGRITSASSGSAGSGTVTSVTYTGDGVLQSATPSSAVTTSGTLTAALLAQAANEILSGPTTGSNANPTFRSLVPADLPVATTSALGAVKPDGTSITISTGVISAGVGIMTALAVGSIILGFNSTVGVNVGNTTAASNITPCGFAVGGGLGGTVGNLVSTGDSITGTWQALQTGGQTKTSQVTLYQRTA